jgi:hypothetical protein
MNIKQILEDLIKYRYDYEYIAQLYKLSPTDVFVIAQEYGDVSSR